MALLYELVPKDKQYSGSSVAQIVARSTRNSSKSFTVLAPCFDLSGLFYTALLAKCTSICGNDALTLALATQGDCNADAGVKAAMEPILRAILEVGVGGSVFFYFSSSPLALAPFFLVDWSHWQEVTMKLDAAEACLAEACLQPKKAKAVKREAHFFADGTHLVRHGVPSRQTVSVGWGTTGRYLPSHWQWWDCGAWLTVRHYTSPPTPPPPPQSPGRTPNKPCTKHWTPSVPTWTPECSQLLGRG
jgi:hypothetical protein